MNRIDSLVDDEDDEDNIITAHTLFCVFSRDFFAFFLA